MPVDASLMRVRQLAVRALQQNGRFRSKADIDQPLLTSLDL
jgi:hypothetical protein